MMQGATGAQIAEPDRSGGYPEVSTTRYREAIVSTGDDAALVGLLQSPERVLAEFATDAAYIAEPDGTLRWLSGALPRVLGWQPEDLVGTALRSLVHPDDAEEAFAWRARLLEGQTPPGPGVRTDPLRFRRADGSWVWCTVSATRALDADGRFVGITGSLHDVDALVQARESAARAHDRLHAVLDALVEPHVTLVALRDGTGDIVDFVYEQANEPAAEFHRRTVDEVIGATLLQVLGEDIGAADVKAAAEVLTTGDAAVWNDMWSYVRERQGLGPTWLDIRIVPVDDDRVSYSWRDVTERYRARADVARSNVLMRRIIDGQVDPFVLFRAVRDDDGTVVDLVYEDLNDAAAQYEGRSREELFGATISGHYRNTTEAAEEIVDCAVVLATGEPLVRTDEPSYEYLDEAGNPTIVDMAIVPIDEDRVSYTWRDVTDRHVAQGRLADSEQRFRLLAENMSEVVMLARDGLVEWVSPSITPTAGWLPEEVVGRNAVDLVHPDDLELVVGTWLSAQEVLPRLRYRLRNRSGEYHWVDAEGRVAVNADGQRVSIVSAREVDTEVAALRALEEMARHDELTGLVNRHEVFRQVDRAISGPARSGNRLAMAFCDLDGFKEVNDAYGHSAGDNLLRAIARRIERVVRAGDVVARLGGDELLIVLNGVHDLDDAVRIADKLRDEIRQPTPVPGGTASVSASIGVALAEEGESVDDIVSRADAAMYQAKKSGKDRVVTIPFTRGR